MDDSNYTAREMGFRLNTIVMLIETDMTYLKRP